MLDDLHQQEADAASVRAEIKRLEGDVIKAARHKVKRLQKKDVVTEEIRAEIASLEQQQAEAKAQVDLLREQVVTSAQFKVARKALQRAEEAVVLEQQDRRCFVDVLTRSFLRYDIGSNVSDFLPACSTTAVLLAYLWRKYDSIASLQGYFEAMDRMGALTVPLQEVELALEESASSHGSVALSDVPSRVRNWTPADVATAVSIASAKPTRRPPVIPFSYITWAAYSEFPDCGETALRNLFNQLVYNPSTGKLDYQLLEELRDGPFPRLHDKLIQFYQAHADPQDALEQSICAVEWIQVTSGLNDDDEHPPIRYRRTKEQRNIASPLANLLRVVDALVGRDNALPELVDRINQLRGSNLAIDMSRLKDDGFGTISLSDGKVRYELQSYKPVHFGFVQVETAGTEGNYGVFRQLMQYSNGPPRDQSGRLHGTARLGFYLRPLSASTRQAQTLLSRDSRPLSPLVCRLEHTGSEGAGPRVGQSYASIVN